MYLYLQCLFSKLWIGRGEGEASLSIALFQIQTNWCGEHKKYNVCIIGPTKKFSPVQDPIGSFPGPIGSFPGPIGSFPDPIGSFPDPIGSFPGPILVVQSKVD